MTETPGPDHAGRPDPGAAATAAEFVEALVRLKRWSGLGYRQLAKRAALHGHALPRSTLTVALNRNTLPREDLVVALASTCGCDDGEVARWVGARRRIAATAGPDRPGPAVRWLGHRHLPGTRERRDPVGGDDPADADDGEALELVARELAERRARQAAAGAALAGRALPVAGFAAAAALFLAAQPARPVLRAVALVAYGFGFLAAAAVPAAGPAAEPPAPDPRAGRSAVLAALVEAPLAALAAAARGHRRRLRCWWAAVAATGLATALAVLALL